MEDKIPKHD